MEFQIFIWNHGEIMSFLEKTNKLATDDYTFKYNHDFLALFYFLSGKKKYIVFIF